MLQCVLVAPKVTVRSQQIRFNSIWFMFCFTVSVVFVGYSSDISAHEAAVCGVRTRRNPTKLGCVSAGRASCLGSGVET